MGNKSSTFRKLQRGSKDKNTKIIIECEDKRKKRKQCASNTRYTVNPRTLASSNDDTIGPRRQSGLPGQSSGDSLLVPPNISDRRRSNSLCGAQFNHSDAPESEGNGTEHRSNGKSITNTMGRKSSSGLVPALNRLRIQQCYKAAKPSMGETILKRASASRPEIRSFLNRLNEQQLDYMAKQMHELISDAVDNIENTDKVLKHANSFGETYAALCPLGFRPDYFTQLADAAIAECVKLDGGLHKRCETLLAWSQLIGAIFTAVRDGYYQRVRFQRRSSLPQSTITKQLSVDLWKSVDHQDSVIR